jgi:3-phosphoshikimate 1-carboxyvinyltransferase
VEIGGLAADSRQADRAVLAALAAANARTEEDDGRFVARKSDLQAFEFDATQCPDLFPPLAALAAHCAGQSVIRGVSRLVHKESDRASALRDVFTAMGIEIDVHGDEMVVHGGIPTGAKVDSHGDHRIAMAAAVAALHAAGPVEIGNAGCVAKSYPAFFEDMARLGAWVA